MWFLYILSWVAVIIQICFVTLSIGKPYIHPSHLLTVDVDKQGAVTEVHPRVRVRVGLGLGFRG